jgi:aminocarboxymuconate-semialdehyde decarboxylase
MVIDAFCHLYPKKLLKAFVKAKLPWIPASLAFEPTEKPHFYDPETRIKYMDKFGIDLQVVAPVSPQLWIPPVPNRLELAKIANDSVFEIVEKYPERFMGVAMVPFLTGEALDELDRAITDLGMKGAQIFSNIDGKPLDSPEFIPFYEKMCRYDLPIWIHPTDTPSYGWMDEYDLNGMLGWAFDTSLAMCRLALGGVLQKYPSLKFIAHHSGGMISFYDLRVRNCGKRLRGKDVIDYFKMFYVDTSMVSIPALKCSLSFFGPEHTVFAIDYPFGLPSPEEATRETLKRIQEIDIPEEDRKMICEGNARRLLKM